MIKLITLFFGLWSSNIYSTTEALVEKCKTLTNTQQLSMNRLQVCKYTTPNGKTVCMQSGAFTIKVSCEYYDGIKAEEQAVNYEGK